MNLKPELVSGRENFPFSGRHGEISAMLASGAIPMIRFRIPGGKEMNMMYPGTRGRSIFSEAGPSTLAAVQNGLQGQMHPLCPPPSGEFQGIFSGAPGGAVSPPSESAASGEGRNKKVRRSPSGLKGGGRNLGFLGDLILCFQGKSQHSVPLKREKTPQTVSRPAWRAARTRSSCHMRS